MLIGNIWDAGMNSLDAEREFSSNVWQRFLREVRTLYWCRIHLRCLRGLQPFKVLVIAFSPLRCWFDIQPIEVLVMAFSPLRCWSWPSAL